MTHTLSTPPEFGTNAGVLPELPPNFGGGFLSSIINFLDSKTVYKGGLFNTEISKVTLVPVSSGGNIEEVNIEELQDHREGIISGELKETSQRIKGFISEMAGIEYEAEGWTEGVFSIDAANSIVKTYSKTPIPVSAETHQVFIDGVITNPDKISISGWIDVQKLDALIKLQARDQWFIVMHTKQLGGTAGSIVEIDGGEKKFFILGTTITDDGDKNTVKVQIEMQEVLLYEVEKSKAKYTIEQTNDVTKGEGGNNGDTTKVKEDIEPEWKFGFKKNSDGSEEDDWFDNRTGV